MSCISSPPRSSGALDFNELSQIARGPVTDCACPLCGPSARQPHNKTRKVLRVWRHDENFLTYKCQRCNVSGWARDGRTGTGPKVDWHSIEFYGSPVEPPEPAKPTATTAPKDETARWLWRHARPARGTLVQRYLEARGCWVDSNILRFLPARADHPPAMIAAFGLPDEPEPGVLEISTSAVRGIHITRLAGDGSGKAGTDKDKIMIGPSSGWPIVLAPANDLLGLCIGEGIEKTAAYHVATGLGAWVAGSAGRMPALINMIPSYIEHVDVLADDDFAGQKSARELSNKLDARRIRHRVVTRSGASHE